MLFIHSFIGTSIVAFLLRKKVYSLNRFVALH
jgi:hypothetical protein